ncbi:DUF6163 family protein [Methylobacterium sp. A54F]|jgi:hypothetical protein
MRGPLGRAGIGDLGNDRIERGAAAPKSTWDTALVWFMRITALVWVAKGVLSWAAILDVLPGTRPFEAEPVGRQVVIVYFAVIDLTAAVGLWLTSAWGGVMWLLAATSALTLAVLTPQLLPVPIALIAAQASIVTIYFALSWLAAREVR